MCLFAREESILVYPYDRDTYRQSRTWTVCLLSAWSPAAESVAIRDQIGDGWWFTDTCKRPYVHRCVNEADWMYGTQKKKKGECRRHRRRLWMCLCGWMGTKLADRSFVWNLEFSLLTSFATDGCLQCGGTVGRLIFSVFLFKHEFERLFTTWRSW